MKKLVCTIISILFLCLATSLMAGGIFVAGTPTSGNGPTVNFSALLPTGFTMDLSQVTAIYVNHDPGIQGTIKNKGKDWAGKANWVLHYRNNPEAFKGAKMYAFGTQEDWPAGGTILSKLSLENPLATADISSGNATFHFLNRYPKESSYYQPIILVIQFADGSRAWGGMPDFPNGQYLAKNKYGAPQLWLLVDNKSGQILPPGKEGRDIAATLQ